MCKPPSIATLLSLLAIIMLEFASPARAAISPADLQQTLELAGKKFDEASALVATDRAQARLLFGESIAHYERIVRDGSINNGGLYYNIANAHMMKGDLGRAVLNYRRAQALTPGDANVAANLGAARARVTPRISQATESRVLRTVLFWHYDLSEGARFSAFSIAFAGLWFLALLRLIGWAPAAIWWAVGALAIASGFALTSLLVERNANASSPSAVVIATEVIGRKGPDARSYEPSFTEPLGAGVELTIIERRPNWTLVRLADGRETWTPDSSIEEL